MGMKMTSKLGMAAATSLAGLAMMGAGSFALFTAHASTPTQSFAAGTVDIAVNSTTPQAFSNLKTISMHNLVPGDYVGGALVVENTGSVDEVLKINTHTHPNGKGQHSPIFWPDGINNGEATMLNGYKEGTGVFPDGFTFAEPASMADSVAQKTYGPDYWQPRTLQQPRWSTKNSGYESYDYAEGRTTTYTDDHPAWYTETFSVYANGTAPTVTMTPNANTNGVTKAPTFNVTGGTLASSSDIKTVGNATNDITYTYTPAGYQNGTGFSGNKGTIGNEAPSFSTEEFSGKSSVQGIVLKPGQYLVIEYTGHLPLLAGNDYQDTWGQLRIGIDAAQWENNHTDSQNPTDVNQNAGTIQPSSTFTA
ncbi:CalY family protein [Alicyclobacillus sp. SP_1]|uniref:CalY family protein n=1 Tax=Alicyclobacillus sp. SP_1 TaxID=2942475 RepID=UPI00215800B0|nr:CalY family protein [Alicyclobacillus sp. SP_1]